MQSYWPDPYFANDFTSTILPSSAFAAFNTWPSHQQQPQVTHQQVTHQQGTYQQGAHQQGICFLEKLPAELRLEIYRYLLVPASRTRVMRSSVMQPQSNQYFVKAKPQITGHAILAVNHMIHGEAAEVMYGENHFEFSNPKVFRIFVEGIRSHSRFLRYLDISNVTTAQPIQLFAAISPECNLKSLRLNLSRVSECKIDNLLQTLLPLLTKSGTNYCWCHAAPGTICVCHTAEHGRTFGVIEMSAWVADLKDGKKQYSQGLPAFDGEKPPLRKGTAKDMAMILTELELTWDKLTMEQWEARECKREELRESRLRPWAEEDYKNDFLFNGWH
ncbi:hypothetical protein LTR17_012385 [Elasticomyces elasticus]|nr:hypothetical protein LTR17_012385 [Elasticomyces elasticus]